MLDRKEKRVEMGMEEEEGEEDETWGGGVHGKPNVISVLLNRSQTCLLHRLPRCSLIDTHAITQNSCNLKPG